MKIKSFNDVRPGDRVLFRTPQGYELRGRVVFACQPSHLTLNIGGRHGTPAVVDPDQFISASRRSHS